jgi:hypothetical protein
MAGDLQRAFPDSSQGGTVMDDAEKLKDEIRKLSARAVAAKMELHDLSEELPLGWERIMEVAQKTKAAYEALFEAKARQK